MADTKVSELPVATTVTGSDTLYLVQGGTSKKVSVETVFANAGNTTLKGNLTLSGTQVLSSPGIIDNSKLITLLSVDASAGTVVLPNGSNEQVKLLIMTASAGGSYTVTGNIANSSNILFSSTGNTATLLFTSGSWYVIGGTARLV